MILLWSEWHHIKKSKSGSESERSHSFFSGLTLTLTLISTYTVFTKCKINDQRDFTFEMVTLAGRQGIGDGFCNTLMTNDS